MNKFLTAYHTLEPIITHIFHSLKLKEREHPKGRKPILSNIEAATCAILQQKQNIATKKMNAQLKGLFIADAGYVSKELEREFFLEHERMMITATRKNMKKITAPMHIVFLNLRMRVEIHFRILKLCYGLVTSFPRSIDGYLTHYLSSICAYLVA